MEYIYIIIAIFIIFIIKIIHDEKTIKQRTMEQLKQSWGNVPKWEYSGEKFSSLQCYYNAHKEEHFDIDNITWNDIDMDEIFMLMNNTRSAIGEEYLYSILRKPKYEMKELEERNHLIHFFKENEKERLNLQMNLSKMGKLNAISVYEYINRTDDIEKQSGIKHYTHALSLILSIILIFFQPVTGAVLTFSVIAINITTYYKRKAKIESYFNVFSYILKMLDGIKDITKLNIPEIKSYLDQLKGANKTFNRFKRGSFIVASGKSMAGGVEDIILDYVRMLFHTDLIKFDTMLKEVRVHREELNGIFETIGLLDSMIAVASFREFIHNNYCEPSLESSTKPYIEAENVYHPLISDPVVNSINERHPVLITGSNASGKSTFIKTMAINTILAQTIYTSLSSHYKASFFKVYSSMALKDDLFSQESYYIVEIKSLKRILDQLDQSIPTLCFVDEVLRGTNTLERIAASSQILLSFAKSNAICFAATHDIELTHILHHYYSNYHFQEKIEDNNIIFDYKLFKGRAMSRNAIKLLGMIGYDNSIIEQATQEANDFLKNGVWNNIK